MQYFLQHNDNMANVAHICHTVRNHKPLSRWLGAFATVSAPYCALHYLPKEIM